MNRGKKLKGSKVSKLMSMAVRLINSFLAVFLLNQTKDNSRWFWRNELKKESKKPTRSWFVLSIFSISSLVFFFSSFSFLSSISFSAIILFHSFSLFNVWIAESIIRVANSCANNCMLSSNPWKPTGRNSNFSPGLPSIVNHL